MDSRDYPLPWRALVFFRDTVVYLFVLGVAVAWSPSFSHGLLHALFGSGNTSVLRGGFSLTNDYYGAINQNLLVASYTQPTHGQVQPIFLDPQHTQIGALKYFPDSREISGTVLYLASDLSAGVTGQAVSVNGGQYFQSP